MKKTKGEQFAGVTVALVTPFRGGEIDFTALRRLVDWHVEQGTDCLSPVGTTGEAPTLDHDEHERVMAAVVACDLPIVLYNIPGRTGSNILPETVARLAEIPTVVAIKEATGSMDQASHIAS